MRTRHLNKTVICVGSLLLGAYGSSPPAHAEGSKAGQWSGAWGVNRVIRTPEGYYAVSAVADLWFFMPTDTDPNTGVEAVTTETNRFDNKPSAYLGSEGAPVGGGSDDRVEVDAGLQFETQLWRTDATVGWSAFISRAGQFTYIRVWNDPLQRWEAWRDPVNTTWNANRSTGSVRSRIQYEITGNRQVTDGVFDSQGVPGTDANGSLLSRQVSINGEASLNLSVFGFGGASATDTAPNPLNTCYWNPGAQFRNPNIGFATDPRFNYRVSPWIGQQIYDISRNAEARVKRVVAMTRANVGTSTGATPALSDLDGSHLTCTYTSGQVARTGSGLASWQHTDVDQARTGYDAPGDNTSFPWMAYDRRWPWANSFAGSDHLWTMYSRSLVEFSNASTRPDASVAFDPTYNRNARAESTDGWDRSRYVRETVRINLRTVTRPTGSPVEVE